MFPSNINRWRMSVKLTNKEKEALSMLRKLDAPQRDRILAGIERTLIANRISERAGKLKKVKPVEDYKITRAFGVPGNRTRT